MAPLLFYLGLGALLTLEEAGLFLLPGDISLVAAGIHEAQHPVRLSIAWIVASIGMTLGASVLFHGVGRAQALNRVLPRRAQELIRQHGIWGVAVARLVPGLRNATVFAASSAGMPFRRFLWGLMPAAMVWSGALLLLGWFGGATVLALFGKFHHSHTLKIISFALLLCAIIIVFWRLRSIREDKPEAVTPNE